MKIFKRMFSSQKIFTLSSCFLCIFCLFFVKNAFADSDFTSSGFTIDLNAMDPIGNRTNAQTSVDGGVSAFKAMLRLVANFLLTLVPVLAGVSLIIAGYFFIFSGGEADRVSKGKGIIKFNLIAMIVAFMSYSIITLISTFFK